MGDESALLLRKIVEMAGGAAETGYVLALEGEGIEDVPASIAREPVRIQVYRPRSELELRRLVWKSAGAPFVALVPEELARRLPRDLVRRARGQRVFALEPNDVLSTVLGVQVQGTEDDEIHKLALTNLDRIRREMSQRTLPTVVDRRLLDELLLDACVGSRVRQSTAAKLLADWLTEGLPPDLAVRRLLARNLPSLYGTAGRVLAWASESPSRLEHLIVRGALLSIPDEVPDLVWGELGAARGDPKVGLADEVLRVTAASVAVDALTALGDKATPWLTRAETVGRQYLLPQVIARSTLLPLGLDNLYREVVQRIEQGAALADAELEPLRRHHAARSRGAELAVVEEMARLTRYVASPTVGPDAGTRERVVHYQQHGAFADLSAARLRRALAATASWHHEAARVLARYRDRRDAENLSFARGLAANYARALHEEGLFALHRLWRDVALPELARDAGRGLYLVVMDGCSYPVFLELLQELAALQEGPIGLRVAGDGTARGLPGVAPLPTVTSHARGAIFLGEIPRDPWAAETLWRESGERVTDPARFRQNPALGGRTRQLFLKGDLADGGRALYDTLSDPGVEVVAAVFNAVDDHIGSSNTGAMQRVEARPITAFVPSLHRALQQGRKVLVVADHGHTPYWGKELRFGADATPRFRELAEGEPPPDGCLEIDLQGLGGTDARRAFAWRMGAYQGSAQVGFHGGCGLEEMVVPLAWLVPEGVCADEAPWWYGARAESVEPASVRREKKLPSAPASVASAQRELFDVRRSVEARAAQITSLRLDEAVVAQLDSAERAALVTLRENGSARARDLAAAVGKTLGRVPGFMTQLHRKLHRAGVERFRTEELPGGEQQYHYVPARAAEEET